MNTTFQIAAFDSEIYSDELIELWVNVFGYETAHNEPSLVIHRKKEMKDGLFFVSLSPEGKVTGTVMGGYDGVGSIHSPYRRTYKDQASARR